MKYLMLLHQPSDRATDQTEPSEADVRTRTAAYTAYRAELEEKGVWLGGEALLPAESATQVRVRDGETLLVDGPLAETGEQLAGYFLLDCRDLDEATELAARIPAAWEGHVEIRPVWTHQ